MEKMIRDLLDNKKVTYKGVIFYLNEKGNLIAENKDKLDKFDLNDIFTLIINKMKEV